MPLYQPISSFRTAGLQWAISLTITVTKSVTGGTRPAPQFPGTMKQMDHQAVHLRALASWRSLSHQVQLEWSDYAKVVTAHRPPFLNENHISGYNLFVSAYHGFATLGNEHVPVPARFEEFPPFDAVFDSAQVIGNADLLLKFSISVSGTGEPLRYRTLGKIQLVAPGRGCHPGKMRNYLSVEISSYQQNPRTIHFIIPNYRDVWGLDLPVYSLHLRYLLLDINTGYRNLHKSLSCSFSL